MEREAAMDPDCGLIFAEYRQSDFAKEAAYLWDYLDEASKQHFLTATVSHLAKFSQDVVKAPGLATFLSEAITFFELYGTWKAYICPDPDCLHLFPNDESLIIHLRSEHLIQLVEPMCLSVQQATKQESDSVDGDVNSKSEFLGRVSFSIDEGLIHFSEAETCHGGERESIISFLCEGPCNPDSRIAPIKASKCYLAVYNFLDDLTAGFQNKQDYLELVYRVQCLVCQLRQLCALDCRVHIFSLMRSFLRMKLYFHLKVHDHKATEEDPAVLCPTTSYQEECIAQKASRKESISDYDLDVNCKLWMNNPTLCSLDSTLSKSATGRSDMCGPFFWLKITDVLKHCEMKSDGMVNGIKLFRVDKSWKYWICCQCNSMFIDGGSHMVHLEQQHQLSIDNNDFWLIPQQGRGDKGKLFRRGVAMRGLSLEDSITLDHTYNYFLVDSVAVNEMPSANEQKEKSIRCLDMLQRGFIFLGSIFQTKHKFLSYLEVVHAIGLILFNGGQPLSILVIWLHKLSNVDSCVGTTFQLHYKFLSQLLNGAHAPGYGPLSNYSVVEAFKNLEQELTSELHQIDCQIVKVVDEIESMKNHLSNLCEFDYRMKIVPCVRSFLHAKFKFDNSLRSLECHNLKDFLSTLDPLVNRDIAYSFKVEVLSPGKVIINTKEKPPWAFAFIGIRLRFLGKWSYKGETELTGVFNFGMLSNWNACTCSRYGSVVLDNHAAFEASYRHRLNLILCIAVRQKLLSFTYKVGAEIRCHGVGDNCGLTNVCSN